MVAEEVVRNGQIIAMFWRSSLADLLLDSIWDAREKRRVKYDCKGFFAWETEKMELPVSEMWKNEGRET